MHWNKLVPEFTVTDYAKSRAFYVDVIGFTLRFERTDPKFGYFDLEGAQIMLEEHHAKGWNVGNLDHPFGRGVNFQIEVSNVEAIYRDVAKNSIPIYRELKEEWYETGDKREGQKEFLVQDPDGYLLRFSEVLKE